MGNSGPKIQDMGDPCEKTDRDRSAVGLTNGLDWSCFQNMWQLSPPKSESCWIMEIRVVWEIKNLS